MEYEDATYQLPPLGIALPTLTISRLRLSRRCCAAGMRKWDVIPAQTLNVPRDHFFGHRRVLGEAQVAQYPPEVVFSPILGVVFAIQGRVIDREVMKSAQCHRDINHLWLEL